ncbi:MAG: choice-of-anchor D domain-containing protein [Chloroflexota bacterium]
MLSNQTNQLPFLQQRRSMVMLVLLAFTLLASFLFYELLITSGRPTGAQVCQDLVTVVNVNDAGAGSLRDGLVNVCPFGTVQIDNALSGQEILLNTQLLVSENMTIRSDVPIIISGQNITRSFRVNTSVDVTFDGLTLRNGRAFGPTFVEYYGAGIYAESGFAVITVTNSIIENNESEREGAGVYSRGPLTVINTQFRNNLAGRSGGAVYARSELSMIDTTIENNQALRLGGGIFIFDAATAEISNTTIYSNTGDEGGAIFNDGAMTLNNVTISGNTAETGGGIKTGLLSNTTLNNVTITENEATVTGAGGIDNDNTLNMTNTLIANSITGADCDTDDGTLATNTNNLVEDNTCTPAVNGDPNLEPLADNGGATQTHALPTGSIAIDAGTTTCLPTDQRGVLRPVGIACDIGAFEYQILPEMIVSANGLEILDGDITPDPFDDTEYEPTAVGDTHVHTFTIGNIGTADLILNGGPLVNIIGGSGTFSVIDSPISPVAAGGTTTFSVAFSPNAEGIFTATVEILNNDPDESPYDFVINGAGTAPEMAVLGDGIEIVSGSSLPNVVDGTDFGASDIPVVQTFEIANTGSGELILSGTPFVLLSGNAEFAVTSQPSSPILPGNSATFDITFTPGGPGSYVGQVQIASNELDENPYTFAIQGSQLSSDSADLNITKIESADPIAPGGLLEYTVVVENIGTLDAAQLIISDTLPANTSYVPGSISGADNRTDGTAPLLTWVDNLLAAGDSVTMTYQVEVDPSATIGSQILNTASVTTTTALAGAGQLAATTSTTIADVSAPSAQFSSPVYTAVEGDGTTLISVNIDPAPAVPVTIDLTVADRSDVANPIVVNGTQTLSFSVGEGSQIVAISINEDSIFEGDQVVDLTLSNPSTGLLVGGTSAATLTLADNDAAPTISFADLIIPEGNSLGSADLPVSLSAAAGVTITVDYATSDISAVAGQDYTAINGLLSIPVGQISGTISIPVLGDIDIEPDELFVVQISNPSAGTISNNNAVVTLTNDDSSTPPATQQSIFLPMVYEAYNMTPDLIVENIAASSTDAAVTIRNIGLAPVSNSFWVDFYISPPIAPTQPNETIQTLDVEGIVWGIQIETVALGPGEALVLNLNDGFMSTEFTNFSGLIPVGSTIYVQVDSAKVGDEGGNVPETHEIFGTPYNNISSITTIN